MVQKLSLSAWAQYVLDSFGSVPEAVEELSQERFTVLTAGVPGQPRDATMHLAISDPTGDSAIFEYLDGRLDIHHDRSYQVMTNSPPFGEQLAINAYWHDIGGTVMRPGTNRASDRYVRASFYVNAVPQVEDRTVATAAVFGSSVISPCPYGISTSGQPNISSTRWRTVADHKDRRYFFDSVLWPSVIWVELDRLDLGESGQVRRLELPNGGLSDLGGDVTSRFEVSEPFQFLGPQTTPAYAYADSRVLGDCRVRVHGPVGIGSVVGEHPGLRELGDECMLGRAGEDTELKVGRRRHAAAATA